MANRARRSRRNPPAEFTPKQLRFVEEYLKDLNGTQAAIRAGYSARTAAVQASRLLTKC
jgi:phage terminase small subunit